MSKPARFQIPPGIAVEWLAILIDASTTEILLISTMVAGT
jgi:hypothetical protein